jgi:threonylcarbamoyladenosine tRNA methylthiotransferase MtaB
MINGIHIGTDIICGLPGETDALFQKSCEFVEKMALSNIHIFRYSPREGTEAAKFADHPHPAIVKKRMKILEEIKRRSSDKFLCSQIGNTATFIGEKKESGNLTSGWSDNYIKTYLKEKNAIGKLIKIKFTAKENSLLFAIQTFYCKI